MKALEAAKEILELQQEGTVASYNAIAAWSGSWSPQIATALIAAVELLEMILDTDCSSLTQAEYDRVQKFLEGVGE